MKTVKKEQSKSSLSYEIKIIAFMFKTAFKVSPVFGVMMVSSIIVKSITPLLWVIMPKYIIDELVGQQRMPVLLSVLGGFMLGVFVLDVISKTLDNYMNVTNSRVFHEYCKMLSHKVMDMDFEYLENPDTLDLKEKALNGLNYWGGIYGLTEEVVKIFSSVITLSALVYMITSLNIILTISLAVIIVSITFISNKIRVLVYSFWDKLMDFNRRFRYLISLMFNYKYGKDLRLFDMPKMLLKKNKEYNKQTHDYYVKQGNRERFYISIKNFISFAQMLLIYGFTVYLTYNETISIGSFVMYISAATSLVLSTTNITESFINLKRVCQYTGPFYDFFHLPQIKPVGTDCVKPSDTWELEFVNVSFRYPKTDVYTLKNVSIKINSSEKLSIVGLNGAGKATFVKLLLRLYDPEEGEIYLNGVDIKTLDYEGYLKMFSVVFQDYGLFAASVKENISLVESANDNDIFAILDKVNLSKKIHTLPKGMDTQILKIFDEAGIEFSGGESGRLALARAVYKDAPFIILDEPTAALDPVAEYEIYKHFDELISNKTTVYISHRLSTCRFCDVVAVFDNGEIVEYNPHSELLKNPDGIYTQMWTAQSQYYV